MSEVRFIIITVPPPDTSMRLENARAAAASFSRSCAALAYPPHVTLRTGAVVPEQSIAAFAEGLQESLGAWRPFIIRMRGLFQASWQSGDGEELHMVAWRIERDAPLLDLHERLSAFTPFRRRAQPAFEPHLTLAFEDITATGARDLLRHAQGDPGTFPPDLAWPCNNIGLYRREGVRWEPFIVLRTMERSP